LKGGHGIVPSTGNLVPGLYKKLYDAAKSGDNIKALEYQDLTDKISAIYQNNRNISQSIPALKVLMSELNLCKPVALPPMYPTNESEISSLIHLFRNELKTVSV
jgi:4-hydroxy-tetrahydrodipicolinate synthase